MPHATGPELPSGMLDSWDGLWDSLRVRPLVELVSDDDAWPIIAGQIGASGGRSVALPAPHDAGSCLVALQVTTRSVLGALALHCGGVLVDHGWVRLYGAGHGGLPSLATVNDLTPSTTISPLLLLVGEDVLGGKYAINGGALPGPLGDVHLWAPDTLAWESLGAGHGDFVRWIIHNGAGALYESLRWPGWETEVAGVALDHSLMLYPPPCTVEGSDTSRAVRRAVPRRELDYWLATLAGTPESPARFSVDP
jgi:hypothetical protein